MGPFLERGISFRANSRTAYKKLAHFLNGISVLGEIFLERGANFESRAAHTHPKNTQVPPPPVNFRQNIMGDGLLLNFRAKFHC